MKATYVSPTTEAITLSVSQALLQGSPQDSLSGMDPNEILDEFDVIFN
jgi:hypothetical protein